MVKQNQQQGHFWARTKTRVYFGHQDMDFYFRWILGRQTFGGSQVGECFYVASHIKDGDPESWQQAWAQMADRVRNQAENALAQGHRVSAREAYLRASTYYRAPLLVMSPGNSGFKDLYMDSQACFRKATSLFDPPCETVEVAFEGKVLPGYFFKADQDDAKRKTLIMIGGGETFVEDLYFYIGPAGIKRGYHVFLVDLPGQGSTPFDGLFFRVDHEVPMAAIVDYLVNRPEVDENRLAAYGISGGGLFVPRAVAHERRIKACIANPPYYDGRRARAAAAAALPPGKDPVSDRVKAQMAWRCGIGTRSAAELAAFQQASDQAAYDPRQIHCPMLCLADKGELGDWIEQAREIYEMLPSTEKTLTITSAEDGVEGHCHLDNLSLMSQIVFDWLDQAFE